MYCTQRGYYCTRTGDNRQFVLPFSDTLPGSLKVERDDTQVVSFSVKGEKYTTFKIKFNSKDDAESYAKNKVTRQSILEALIPRYELI